MVTKFLQYLTVVLVVTSTLRAGSVLPEVQVPEAHIPEIQLIPEIPIPEIQKVLGTPEKLPVITVFIHGTVLRYFSLPIIYHMMRIGMQEVYGADSAYQQTLRFHTVFRQQPMTPEGLWVLRAPAMTNRITQSNNAFVDTYEAVWRAAYPNEKNLAPQLYAFGWDGRLSRRHRRRAAYKLYDALMLERTKLAITHNCLPDQIAIQVFGHSHGGNVALLLAHVHNEKKQNLTIKQLVLMGTPIQQETMDFVCDPLFKSVINIYSMGDIVQTGDRFSTRGKSLRRPVCEHNELHVKNVEITVAADEQESKRLEPLHAQLWGFDANNVFINALIRKIPINPFPISTFLPALLALIERTKGYDFNACIVKYKESGYRVQLEPRERAAVTGPDSVLLAHNLFDGAKKALRFS